MQIPRWAVAAAAVGVLVLAGAGILAATVGPFAASPIVQPIAFPHDLHAGATSQIPCQYCHTSADRSQDAGIPSVQVCAGCHFPGGVPLVRADHPEVLKLREYWAQGVAIPWKRIYDLPDHVHFPHMRHMKAGFECQECHGPVEEMAVIEQASSLRMGWCVECHRVNEARTDCFVCHY